MSVFDTHLKISGAIGLKILYNSKINKKIFIFYDDHSNTNYCDFADINAKKNLFISELFNEIIDRDVAMILEEPFIDSDSKIKILWKNSEHLFLFRKFYSKLINKCSNTKICKLFPIDIRLAIYDVSPDEIIFNLSKPRQEYNIKLSLFFQHVFYLFDLNDINDYNNSICIFIKKVFDVYKSSKFYKFLKKRIIDFSKKYNINQSNDTIYDMILKNINLSNFIYEEGFPYVSNVNNNFIDQLDKISSAIMEFYSLILILSLSNKNIIYFAGYYHSNNIAHILNKFYDFEQEYISGKTDNINEETNKINNCIKINKNYFKLIQ